MPRVSAHVAAATALASAALVVFATATVYAKDVPSGRAGNPGNHYGEIDNPGHHYGQHKHQPPVTAPSPPPQPRSTPGPVTQPPAGSVAITASSRPAAAAGASSPDLALGLPAATHPADNVAFANPTPQDPLWWVVLLILPALLAVWMIVAGRMVQRLTRTRNRPAAALAGAPAV
jgi:hypothetical protein